MKHFNRGLWNTWRGRQIIHDGDVLLSGAESGQAVHRLKLVEGRR